MKKRALCIAAAGVVLITTAACRSDDIDDLNLPTSRLILFGRVVDEAGVGVSGARVDMTYNPRACSVPPRKRQDTMSGADGRYREVFETPADFQGCMHLRVTASGFLPDSAARMDGVFKPEAPFDSVQTNFTLIRR